MLVIGLITSLIQSVTSIQEPTLTFTPKLLVFALISLVVAPWLLRTLGEFTISIFTRMSTLAH
jgi:flagellar biosynthetic protein FliQ